MRWAQRLIRDFPIRSCLCTWASLLLAHATSTAPAQDDLGRCCGWLAPDAILLAGNAGQALLRMYLFAWGDAKRGRESLTIVNGILDIDSVAFSLSSSSTLSRPAIVARRRLILLPWCDSSWSNGHLWHALSSSLAALEGRVSNIINPSLPSFKPLSPSNYYAASGNARILPRILPRIQAARHRISAIDAQFTRCTVYAKNLLPRCSRLTWHFADLTDKKSCTV